MILMLFFCIVFSLLSCNRDSSGISSDKIISDVKEAFEIRESCLLSIDYTELNFESLDKQIFSYSYAERAIAINKEKLLDKISDKNTVEDYSVILLDMEVADKEGLVCFSDTDFLCVVGLYCIDSEIEKKLPGLKTGDSFVMKIRNSEDPFLRNFNKYFAKITVKSILDFEFDSAMERSINVNASMINPEKFQEKYNFAKFYFATGDGTEAVRNILMEFMKENVSFEISDEDVENYRNRMIYEYQNSPTGVEISWRINGKPDLPEDALLIETPTYWSPKDMFKNRSFSEDGIREILLTEELARCYNISVTEEAVRKMTEFYNITEEEAALKAFAAYRALQQQVYIYLALRY